MFVEPIINKKTDTVLEAFKKIHRRMNLNGENIKAICSDLGTEFVNREFKSYLSDSGISQRHSKRLNQCPIVERSNRTIKGIISRYLTEHQTPRYIDNLDKIVYTYNNRVHRMIKMTPAEAELPENQERLIETFLQRYGKIPKKRPKFAKGMLVRISKSEYRFRRSWQEQLQEEVFIVDSVDTSRKIPLYEIRELDTNTKIIGRFMSFELTKINENTKFRYKKVLKRKQRGSLSLITFHGLPERFNSWVESRYLANVIQNGNNPVFTPLLQYINK